MGTGAPPPLTLEGGDRELPWYHQLYAARSGVLFDGVARLFSGTLQAMYGDSQTDVLALFMSTMVFALVAAAFFILWRNLKK